MTGPGYDNAPAEWPRMALPKGTLIAGYEVRSVLGRGGFGITYRAEHPVTGKIVALKELFMADVMERRGVGLLIDPDFERDLDAYLDKFRDSISVLQKLKHPNIVGVAGYVDGRLYDDQLHTGFMMMDFVEGDTLAKWLGQETASRRTVASLRAVLEPIMGALEFLHKNNVMHRDVKPDNIMIRPDGVPILIDFGAFGRGLEKQSRSTSVARGYTAGYAPPEQRMRQAVQGAFTDVYGMAATIYACFAGVPPADSDDRLGNLAVRKVDTYEPLARKSLVPLAPAFTAAIDRGLRLDPEERPQTIPDLRTALRWAAGPAAAPPAAAGAPARASGAPASGAPASGAPVSGAPVSGPDPAAPASPASGGSAGGFASGPGAGAAPATAAVAPSGPTQALAGEPRGTPSAGDPLRASPPISVPPVAPVSNPPGLMSQPGAGGVTNRLPPRTDAAPAVRRGAPVGLIAAGVAGLAAVVGAALFLSGNPPAPTPVAVTDPRPATPPQGQVRLPAVPEPPRYAIAALRAELEAAGSDIARLEAFMSTLCDTACPLRGEAETRLGQARIAAAAARRQQQQEAFNRAGDDPERLAAFLATCGADCEMRPAAESRLAALRTAERERAQLGTAGYDVARLQPLAERAETATVRSEAADRLRLIREETERMQAAMAEANRQADPARAFELLDRFLQTCTACTERPAVEARRRDFAAEVERRQGQERLLTLAGDDPDQLRRLIDDPAFAEPLKRQAQTRYDRAVAVIAARERGELDRAGFRPEALQPLRSARTAAVRDEAQRRLQVIETDGRDVREAFAEADRAIAGDDMRALEQARQRLDRVATCETCRDRTDIAAKRTEVTGRLAAIDRRIRLATELDRAGSDTGALQRFLQRCGSPCEFEAEARRRIAEAELRSRTAADLERVRRAGGDVAALEAIRRETPSDEVRGEIDRRLAEIRSEAERVAARRQEERRQAEARLAAARGDAAALDGLAADARLDDDLRRTARAEAERLRTELAARRQAEARQQAQARLEAARGDLAALDAVAADGRVDEDLRRSARTQADQLRTELAARRQAEARQQAQARLEAARGDLAALDAVAADGRIDEDLRRSARTQADQLRAEANARRQAEALARAGDDAGALRRVTDDATLEPATREEARRRLAEIETREAETRFQRDFDNADALRRWLGEARLSADLRRRIEERVARLSPPAAPVLPPSQETPASIIPAAAELPSAWTGVTWVGGTRAARTVNGARFAVAHVYCDGRERAELRLSLTDIDPSTNRGIDRAVIDGLLQAGGLRVVPRSGGAARTLTLTDRSQSPAGDGTRARTDLVFGLEPADLAALIEARSLSVVLPGPQGEAQRDLVARLTFAALGDGGVLRDVTRTCATRSAALPPPGGAVRPDTTRATPGASPPPRPAARPQDETPRPTARPTPPAQPRTVTPRPAPAAPPPAAAAPAPAPAAPARPATAANPAPSIRGIGF